MRAASDHYRSSIINDYSLIINYQPLTKQLTTILFFDMILFTVYEIHLKECYYVGIIMGLPA